MTIITPPQAADIASVHPDTVRRWLLNPQRQASIKFTVSAGGQYAIDEESFRAYLDAPVIVTNTAWAKPKTKKATPHTTAMQRAIAKHEAERAATMARIANMGKVTE